MGIQRNPSGMAPPEDITRQLPLLPRAEQLSLFRRARDQCVLIRQAADETIAGLDSLMENLSKLDGTG